MNTYPVMPVIIKQGTVTVKLEDFHSGVWTAYEFDLDQESQVGLIGIMDHKAQHRMNLSVTRAVLTDAEVVDEGERRDWDKFAGVIADVRAEVEAGAPPRMALTYLTIAATHAREGHDGPWGGCDTCHRRVITNDPRTDEEVRS